MDMNMSSNDQVSILVKTLRLFFFPAEPPVFQKASFWPIWTWLHPDDKASTLI